jgi:hypothetical protein
MGHKQKDLKPIKILEWQKEITMVMMQHNVAIRTKLLKMVFVPC